MEKQFKYGGFTFEPKGKFRDFGIKEDFRSMSEHLYLLNAGSVADGDEPFNYDEFYQAAGDVDADVFRCVENDVLYVPCRKELMVFAITGTSESLLEDYRQRRRQREEHERLLKQEALKKAMTLTDKQSAAIDALREAAFSCCDAGLHFAVDGTDLYVFRADLLKDITEDMAAQDGQTHIETGMYLAIENAWDACEGLYANCR